MSIKDNIKPHNYLMAMELINKYIVNVIEILTQLK